MKKLTLEHLSPYFPYGLKVIATDSSNNGSIETIIGLQGTEIITDFDCAEMDIFKPILRPLSDLTKDELVKQGFDTHIDFLTHEKRNPLEAPYKMVEYLFSKHFDVFGLLEVGLAIDINTLNTENDETN